MRFRSAIILSHPPPSRRKHGVGHMCRRSLQCFQALALCWRQINLWPIGRYISYFPDQVLGSSSPPGKPAGMLGCQFDWSLSGTGARPMRRISMRLNKVRRHSVEKANSPGAPSGLRMNRPASMGPTIDPNAQMRRSMDIMAVMSSSDIRSTPCATQTP